MYESTKIRMYHSTKVRMNIAVPSPYYIYINRLDITSNTQAIICFIFSFIVSNAADCKSTETSEV